MIAGVDVEFDHRTVSQCDQLPNLHLGAPELDGDLHRHIHHQLDVVGCASTADRLVEQRIRRGLNFAALGVCAQRFGGAGA